MKINKKAGDIAFKCRGLFWGLFAAGILIFPSRFNIWSAAAGLLLLAGGQYLRWRAAGYIPKYRAVVIGAPVLVTCPECQQDTYEKQVTAAGFQLKGNGWYATDFKGKSGAPAKPEMPPACQACPGANACAGN